MTSSMTAFGRIEQSIPAGQVIWEIRTVNHRYLDIALRLPEELRAMENTLRERISARIGRGKVDCTLRFEAESQETSELPVNRKLADTLLKTAVSLSDESTGPINPLDILRWPGVIERQGLDIESLGKSLLPTLDSCLDVLLETRQREGEKLKNMLVQRCDAAEEQVKYIGEKLPEISAKIRERYLKKAQELKVELDPERLEQEMLILAQKMDVAEELDRLNAHIEEVKRVLDANKPAGRRLDFLMQELNREANTLGSKAASVDMSNVSVELKVLIEQMREQIQNIE